MKKINNKSDRTIYFNFLYSPSGGAYQNALSFIEVLLDEGFNFHNVKFFVFTGTELENLCIENSIDFFSVKNRIYEKYLFELYYSKFIQEGDLVFSLFGPPMLGTDNKSINIGGMAISNVFYNNIEFWGYLNPFYKTLKVLKDKFRKLRYKKLDYWIFETELIKEMAVNQFNFPSNRCKVVKMTPSVLVSFDKIKKLEIINKNKAFKCKHKFLFLCGAHPNKRLHTLPALALYLSSIDVDYKFFFTVKENDYFRKIMSDAAYLGVDHNFINLSPIKAHDVASVINACDYICTFSLLESFSNNFVEAWSMRKPLFVTSSDWAIHSCGKAAIYINVDNQNLMNKQIANAINSPTILHNSIKNGDIQLTSYPSAKEKTLMYIEAINHVKQLGKISKKERSEISI